MNYNTNNINYEFIEEEDGWISIYRNDSNYGGRKFLVQAKDIEKAKSYCCLIEPAPYFIQRLC